MNEIVVIDILKKEYIEVVSVEILVENFLDMFVVVDFIFLSIENVKVEVMEIVVNIEVKNVKLKEGNVIFDLEFMKLEVGDERMNIDFLIERLKGGIKMFFDNVGNVRS